MNRRELLAGLAGLAGLAMAPTPPGVPAAAGRAAHDGPAGDVVTATWGCGWAEGRDGIEAGPLPCRATRAPGGITDGLP